MNVQTTRFGAVQIEADDILLFREGLIGFEGEQHWVVLADGENPTVAWLQSIHHPELALPIVSPRRFLPGYQVRVESTELDNLQLKSVSDAHVLSIVGQGKNGLCMNLRAPIIINVARKLGCQVITFDEQPMQYELPSSSRSLKRSA